MAKSRKKGVIGSWAFLIGVILAVVLGLLGMVSQVWVTILVVIGLVVGLLNVTDEEAMPFLMSGAVLIIASSLGQTEALASIPYLKGVLDAILLIFVPATIIVAIKNVFVIARD
jgi:uncharacterized membrane protein